MTDGEYYFIDNVDRDLLHRDIYIAVLSATASIAVADIPFYVARAQSLADAAAATYQPYREPPPTDQPAPTGETG